MIKAVCVFPCPSKKDFPYSKYPGVIHLAETEEQRMNLNNSMLDKGFCRYFLIFYNDSNEEVATEAKQFVQENLLDFQWEPDNRDNGQRFTVVRKSNSETLLRHLK